MTDQNKLKAYNLSESCKSNSINELQKNEIRKSILFAIENGNFYPSLAEEACKAISYINNYSDASSIVELVDVETGKVFRGI